MRPFPSIALLAAVCLTLAVRIPAMPAGDLRVGMAKPFLLQVEGDDPSDRIVPSAGSFFSSMFAFQFEANLFPKGRGYGTAPFLGFFADYRKLTGDYGDANKVLGNLVVSKCVGLGVGLSRKLNAGLGRGRTRLHAAGHVTLTFSEGVYQGQAFYMGPFDQGGPEEKRVISYEPTLGLRLAGGTELFAMRSLPVSFGLDFSYERRALSRGNAAVYRNGAYQGEVVPMGDKIFPDHVLSAGFTMAYGFGDD